MDHLTANQLTTKGSFEFIEAKIRPEADGTAFSGDFERLCKWFLEIAPRYRSKFEKGWLWYDWPDRKGTSTNNFPEAPKSLPKTKAAGP